MQPTRAGHRGGASRHSLTPPHSHRQQLQCPADNCTLGNAPARSRDVRKVATEGLSACYTTCTASFLRRAASPFHSFETTCTACMQASSRSAHAPSGAPETAAPDAISIVTPAQRPPSKKSSDRFEALGSMCTKKESAVDAACPFMHGCNAWPQRMAATHGRNAWLQRMAATHGRSACLKRMAAAQGICSHAISAILLHGEGKIGKASP